MKRALATFAIIVLPIISGCGGDQSRGGSVSGDTLTIYSSLPLQGPQAQHSSSIVNAEKLALKQAGGKAGSFKINYASRDDSTAGEKDVPGWSAGRTADNASKAAQDSRTIAYIGEFDSGASAISIPVTNEAGFVQVSPAATAVGLTKLVPGADKGEPDKYYPSGDRSFARVIPADDVQASAAARWARELGARRAVAVHDKSPQGQGIIEQFRIEAEEVGIDVVDLDSMDPRADDYADVARDIADERPDLVYFGGGVESNALRFWRDLAAELPRARLMGSGRLASPDFYGSLGSTAARTFLTSATQDTSQLPQRGKRFLREYRREFGQAAGPYSAYGHAAMSLLIDAIRRAGDRANQREEIVKEVFATTGFESAVGTFSIDDNGDTSLETIAGYRVRDGALRFVKALRGRAKG